MCRNVIDGGEPPLTDLLLPACRVERDDDVGFVRFEVGRRIVEGEMAVLADADNATSTGDAASSRPTSCATRAASPSPFSR